ncbi:MAG: penicillin-binding protein activator [Sediminimonas qiaohouensis]|uniref:Penicillin-binding protein activator n=1 Tax=Sediminimonas qiaohouensis TaxID=552061 RepID=A0A7C9LMA3_9RHOB|nr:penicillin-binding protein activator [Sediminimonas qiaohouensis]MTJ05399.1 penicillin-binding protein activator [Sediminimonas qiaohouensis]
MFAVLSFARKPIARIIVILSALWLTACQPVGLSPGAGPRIDTSAPVPVALLVPRGSGNSGDAVLAQSLENAARLAIQDLQGVQIDLRVYDTAAAPQQARSAAVRAVDEGARIILGPVYAETANAAAVAVAPRGINVLSFSNNTTIAGGNLFVLGQTFQNTANRLASYAAAQGKYNVLAVHSNDTPGRLGRQAIADAVARNGMTMAGSVSYEMSQEGVIDAVARIVERVDETNADTLFLTANTAGALPLLSQLLPEAGLAPGPDLQFIGLTRWDIPAQTLELPGVQGGWFALPAPALSARFRSRYEEAYSGAPHPIGGLAYDGVAAIGALVRSGQRDALTAASLTQSAGFQGVDGILRLRRDGTNERGLAVARITDKKVDVIDPAPRSFNRAGF